MIDGIIEIVRKVKDLNNRKNIAKDMIKKFEKDITNDAIKNNDYEIYK